MDPSISKRCHGYTDFNVVDDVELLNWKIAIALENQRVSIVSKSQNKLKVNTDFKREGNKIQYLLNEEGLQNLDNLANNINFCDIKGVLSLIDTEMRALIYRYKLLKVADKHSSNTAEEYTYSDIVTMLRMP